MADKILITGAAGYIGHKLAQRLAARLPVVGVDIRSPAEIACPLIQCDIRDPALADILRREQISHVVHLASVLESSGDEERDYDIDVNGTRNVIAACLSAGVKHLTVTSSGAAYGYHADNPEWLTEDHPLRANRDFPYAWHKYLVEQELAQAREKSPQLQQLILRPGTVLGANTRNQITNLFEKKRVLAICGSRSPFVFIWDEDVIGIIEQGILESRSGIYNLAGDGALPIDEIAALLEKPLLWLPAGILRAALAVGHALGLSRHRPAQVNFLRYRPVLDNQRLKSEFGYTLRLSSRETFELFIRHARERGQL